MATRDKNQSNVTTKRRVTMDDIARECSVSKYTVSVALGGRQGVAEKTRERIAEAARRLDFRPSFAARSLSRGKTELIGLLLPYVVDRMFGILAESFGTAVSENGYNLVLELVGGEHLRRARGLDLVQENRVDGLLIWAGAYGGGDSQEFADVARRHPLVVIGGDLSSETDCVAIDRTETFKIATQHMASLSHKQIGWVGFDDAPSAGEPAGVRELGYVAGLKESGLTYQPDLHYKLPVACEQGGYAVGKQIAASSVRPTAVVVVSTTSAIGLIVALRESGIRVPDDVAVITYGLDEQPEAVYCDVPLTVMGVSQKQLVDDAVDMLMDRLESNNRPTDAQHRRKVVLVPDLIIRKSCGSVRYSAGD